MAGGAGSQNGEGVGIVTLQPGFTAWDCTEERSYRHGLPVIWKVHREALYRIIDTKNREVLLIGRRAGKQTVAEPRQAATAQTFAYLLCAHDGCVSSKDTPQIQEFVNVKTSDNNR